METAATASDLLQVLEKAQQTAPGDAQQRRTEMERRLTTWGWSRIAPGGQSAGSGGR